MVSPYAYVCVAPVYTCEMQSKHKRKRKSKEMKQCLLALRLRYGSSHVCLLALRLRYGSSHVCLLALRLRYGSSHVCLLALRLHYSSSHVCLLALRLRYGSSHVYLKDKRCNTFKFYLSDLAMSKCLFKKKTANAIKIVTLVGRAHNEMCISVGGKPATFQ